MGLDVDPRVFVFHVQISPLRFHMPCHLFHHFFRISVCFFGSVTNFEAIISLYINDTIAILYAKSAICFILMLLKKMHKFIFISLIIIQVGRSRSQPINFIATECVVVSAQSQPRRHIYKTTPLSRQKSAIPKHFFFFWILKIGEKVKLCQHFGFFTFVYIYLVGSTPTLRSQAKGLGFLTARSLSLFLQYRINGLLFPPQICRRLHGRCSSR